MKIDIYAKWFKINFQYYGNLIFVTFNWDVMKNWNAFLMWNWMTFSLGNFIGGILIENSILLANLVAVFGENSIKRNFVENFAEFGEMFD